MRRPFLFLLIAVLAVLPFGLVACSGPDSDDQPDTQQQRSGYVMRKASGQQRGFAGTLPTCPTTTLVRSGAQATGIQTANTTGTWDLTGASWSSGAGGNWPVRSDAWGQGCLVGAAVNGLIPRTATRDQFYDGLNGGAPSTSEAYNHTLTSGASNYLYMLGSFAKDVEDAFDPNGTDSAQMVTLDRVHAEYVRDDCIENESNGAPGTAVASMTIIGSLFDGCFTGFGERPPGSVTAQNGTGAATFTMEDSLVYVQPMLLGANYCDAARVANGRCLETGTTTDNLYLGSYGFWKWSDKAAGTVTIRNTIFRLDAPSYSSCTGNQWPAGTYQNVTLVWTGAGSYSTAGGCTNTLPSGVTLTTDVSVWDNAKAAWLPAQGCL